MLLDLVFVALGLGLQIMKHKLEACAHKVDEHVLYTIFIKVPKICDR